MTNNLTLSEIAPSASDRPHADGALRTRPIERIALPSVAVFVRDYAARRQPVVLRAAAADWPARQRWSLDYLQREFAGVQVTTIHAPAGRVVMDADGGSIETCLPLGECIDAFRAGAVDRYVTSRTASLPEEMRNQIRMLPYCADAAWRNSNFWLGAPGTIARMHRDLADNLHVLVFGRKRFTLVAPAHSARVYPNTLFDTFPNGCRTDVERPDFTRFPKMRALEPLVADLEPGDAIYIPRRWWHHVRTLEASASINYWFANGRHRLLILAADYAKRIRGISR